MPSHEHIDVVGAGGEPEQLQPDAPLNAGFSAATGSHIASLVVRTFVGRKVGTEVGERVGDDGNIVAFDEGNDGAMDKNTVGFDVGDGGAMDGIFVRAVGFVVGTLLHGTVGLTPTKRL